MPINTLDISSAELIIEEISEVAEHIHSEIYGTWKYRELDVGAQYGSRIFSPKCFYECYQLYGPIENLCKYMGYEKEIVEVSENLASHMDKLISQQLRCYEFFDAEALYQDLAHIVMFAIRAIRRCEIKLSDSNE